MKRFYYSALRDGQECEGIIRAGSIDEAKKKLLLEGYEEITLSILSSLGQGPEKQFPDDLTEPPSS